MAAQEKVFSSFNFTFACTHSVYCISKTKSKKKVMTDISNINLEKNSNTTRISLQNESITGL